MAKTAFKFPFAKKTATASPALPMGSPPQASVAMVPAQSSAPARFSFRSFAKRRKPAARPDTSIALRGAQSREIVRSDGKGDTLGGIFAKSLAPGIGAYAGGVLDETPASKAIEKITGGVLNLSDVVMVAGGLARGAELDAKMPLVGQYVKRANTAYLTGIIPAKFYNAGRRSGAHLWGDDKKASASAPAKKSEEPVPGEMTLA